MYLDQHLQEETAFACKSSLKHIDAFRPDQLCPSAGTSIENSLIDAIMASATIYYHTFIMML